MLVILFQADDLLCLNNEITLKDNKIKQLESQLSKNRPFASTGTSELARKRREDAKHRDQLNALQKLLDNTNNRLKESNISKNQLVVDLEHRNREYRLLEHRCEELLREKQKLSARLEAISIGVSPDSVRSPSGIKVRSQTLNDQLKCAKENTRTKERELDEMGRELEEAKVKITVLQEALDFRSAEIGLSGHADLLAKLASFRGEVTALKNDLFEKRNKLHDIEAEHQSARESNLTLQQQVDQLRERLAQSKSDLQRIQKGDSLLEKLSQVENERDVLLAFVQEDLQKNSDLTLATDRALKEASEAKRNLDYVQDQLKKQSELVDSQAARISDLEGRQAALVSESANARSQAVSRERDLEEYKARLNKKSLESEEMSNVHIELLEKV